MFSIQKVWNSIGYFVSFSPKIRLRSRFNCRYPHFVDSCGTFFFPEIRAKTLIFVFVFIFCFKVWRSLAQSYQQKSGNSSSSIGEGTIYLEQPNWADWEGAFKDICSNCIVIIFDCCVISNYLPFWCIPFPHFDEDDEDDK